MGGSGREGGAGVATPGAAAAAAAASDAAAAAAAVASSSAVCWASMPSRGGKGRHIVSSATSLSPEAVNGKEVVSPEKSTFVPASVLS